MTQIIVNPGAMVRGILYFEAARLDVSDEFAIYLIAQGAAYVGHRPMCELDIGLLKP